MTLKEDLDWYEKIDKSQYNGKWIALINRKIVASDTSLKTVITEFKEKYPKKTPFIERVNLNQGLRIGPRWQLH